MKKVVAKLVFTGDRRQLEMIKQRTRSIVAVHGIDVELSEVKEDTKDDKDNEETRKVKGSKKKKGFFNKILKN